MAKIMIECGNPNDFSEIVDAAERAAGSCTITYAKVAQEKIEAGQADSIREAARQIAEETGETEETVRNKVRRGVGQPDPKPQPTVTTTEPPKLEKLEKPNHGGARKGSGRKKMPSPETEQMSPEFETAWNALFTQLKNEKHIKWKHTSQATAIKYINILYDVATIK